METGGKFKKLKELARRIGRKDLGITSGEIREEMSWGYREFYEKRMLITAAGINIITVKQAREVEIAKDIERIWKLAEKTGREDLSLTPIEIKTEMGWTPTFWRSRKPFILAAGIQIVQENTLLRRRKLFRDSPFLSLEEARQLGKIVKGKNREKPWLLQEELMEGMEWDSDTFFLKRRSVEEAGVKVVLYRDRMREERRLRERKRPRKREESKLKFPSEGN